MKIILLVVVLVGLLGAAVTFAVDGWLALEGVQMSVHGLLAMALGVTISLLLGVGLMALVFYSSRHGHDDDSHLPPGNG